MRKQIIFSIIGIFLLISVITFATPLGETVLKSIGVISVDKADLSSLTAKGMNEIHTSDLTCKIVKNVTVCHYFIKDLNGNQYNDYFNRNSTIYKGLTNEQAVKVASEIWLKERIANDKVVENKEMINKISVDDKVAPKEEPKPIEEPIGEIKG